MRDLYGNPIRCDTAVNGSESLSQESWSWEAQENRTHTGGSLEGFWETIS